MIRLEFVEWHGNVLPVSLVSVEGAMMLVGGGAIFIYFLVLIKGILYNNKQLGMVP